MKIYLLLVPFVLGLSLFATSAEKSQEEGKSPSPLVGRWVSVLTLGRVGPTQIISITINDDGSYHWLDINMTLGKTKMDDPTSYAPDDAEFVHSSGVIDLESGREILTEAQRELSVKSVRWSVKDGELVWSMDMGGLGGQGLTFSRVVH